MYKVEFSENNTAVIIVDKTELDINKTLDCGQAFRWNKVADNWWIGVAFNSLVSLKQCSYKQYENAILTNVTKDNLPKLIEYLDLATDYTSEISKLNLDNYATKAYNYSRGIHILRQNLFETIVTFLMSSCNTMRNIRNIVNKLSERYGEKLEVCIDNQTFTSYTFPTLKQLSDATVAEFQELSMGFRAEYLYQFIQQLKANSSALDKLKDCSYNTAITSLKSLNGIGDKVANCICLFGLHHVEAFPIDTHIKHIIENEYNGYLDIKSFGNIAGIIQQYMFYYETFGSNTRY